MAANREWLRIQDLFEAATPWGADERSTRLEQLEPDAEIRERVLALLRAADAEARASASYQPPEAPALPEQIGPFRILRLAGAGGRGRVYEAVRQTAGTEQRVALKVMLDHLISPKDLERFEREQRMLLRLDHPGIARFVDAGWEGGRPYFAMEWVEGETIGAWCDKHGSNRETRLRLIRDLLAALQAAHRNLVAHLDLKPSNVLVDRDGRVRVLDFGTAKLMEDGDHTSTEQMTPRYASPEQLRAEPASTACDLYSVGLLLHELVTGEWPFGAATSIAALGERAAGRVLPKVRTGAADLDAIVGKAVQFEPGLRYASAEEFAEDLEAFLAGRPVRARKPTLGYQVTRWMARNRRSTVAGLVAVQALAALIGDAAWQREQRYREALRGQEIARFLRWMITSSAIPGSGNPAMTVTEMVERGNARLREAHSLPADVAASIQADFAFLTQERGREDLAETMAREAVQRADQSGAAGARLKARDALASLLLRRGQCPEAMELLRVEETLQGGGAAPLADRVGYLLTRASASERCEGKPAEAVRWVDEALRVAEALPEESFGVAPAVYRAGIHLNYALLLARAGRPQDGLAAASRGLELAASHPDGRYFRVALLRIRSQAHAAAGDTGKALGDIREAARLAPGVVNPFEEVRLQTLLAGRLVDAGDPADAARTARNAVAVARSRQSEIGPSFWMILADAAEVMAKADACEETRALYGEVEQLTQGQMPRTWLGNRYFYLAECAAKQNPQQAAALARKALEAYGDLLPANGKRRARILELLSAKH
jgi:serine/threonine-protein kinase